MLDQLCGRLPFREHRSDFFLNAEVKDFEPLTAVAEFNKLADAELRCVMSAKGQDGACQCYRRSVPGTTMSSTLRLPHPEQISCSRHSGTVVSALYAFTELRVRD